MNSNNLFQATLVKQALSEKQIENLVPHPDAKENRKTRMLSDLFLMPGSLRRAGRTQGLSETHFSEDADFENKFPATSQFLHGLAGATIGGSLGFAAGAGAEALGADRGATQVGSYAGGLLGIIGASALNARGRRENQREILERIEEQEKQPEQSYLKPGNPLASLMSGVHQQGRADVSDAIKKNRTTFENNPAMTAARLGMLVPGGLFLLGPAHAAGNVYNYAESRKRLRNNNKNQPIKLD